MKVKSGRYPLSHPEASKHAEKASASHFKVQGNQFDHLITLANTAYWPDDWVMTALLEHWLKISCLRAAINVHRRQILTSEVGPCAETVNREVSFAPCLTAIHLVYGDKRGWFTMGSHLMPVAWEVTPVVVQEQGHQTFFFVQTTDYIRSELTEL